MISACARSLDSLLPYLNPLDPDHLRELARTARPVSNFMIDNFLRPDFADRVEAAFPSYEQTRKVGTSYVSVNEQKKFQLTDASQFGEPIAEMNRVLASQPFLDLMSYAFDIPNLVADPELVGGGIHETGPRGLLDVHIDFNYIEARKLHRRLNILVYFNKNWRPE